VIRLPAAAATSDPRATGAAAEVLRAGGNAVDAAVAAALVLYVVEPQSAGVGGDAFLIVVEPGRPPVALDGAGALPLGLTTAALAADGLDTVPVRGGRTVTVPGAVGLLDDALRRFGSQTLADLARPAISLAADGFEVRPSLAAAAARAAGEIGADPVLGPLYVPGGTAVATGARIRNPALAECLRTVAQAGTPALYGGPLGEALIDTVASDGGYLSGDDLARHRTTEMELVSASFAGHVVWELGPPTQGPAVVTAVEQITAASPTDWAAVLGAVRDGMRTAGFDPAAIGARPAPARGDTTYIAVVDGDGRGASLITSVFGDFGSHLGVPAFGGPVGNRATMLRALRREPTPGAKPPHTTIPAAVTRDDGGLRYVLGVAGGFMQPQAQVQLLVRMLVEGMAPQEAIDAPRFKVLFGGDVAVEPGHPLLATMPEAGDRPPGPEGFGGAQVVGWHGERLMAGADARRGGHAQVMV
jgi:gamma-glutamyltranspeptidase/glutathione hydrolase